MVCSVDPLERDSGVKNNRFDVKDNRFHQLGMHLRFPGGTNGICMLRAKGPRNSHHSLWCI
jgi:hypothetical protein